MRKAIYRMDPREARRFLERASVVHVITTRADGAPLFRTVNAVVVDDCIAFHGAPAGEKMEALGRPAIVSAEDIVASIPSYFVDPERACPATTYYRSVQVHGALEPIDDAPLKARVLAALMAKYQPEGGHVPIDPEHALYQKAIEGLLVVRVALERIDGKAKLGQNRRPEELRRVLELLWARGHDGDARAIDLVRAHNADIPDPAFLTAPEGVRLACAPGEDDLERAVDLLAPAYWNVGIGRDALATAHRCAAAWVGARDASGQLVATARAMSDGAKRAYLLDVIVDAAWRGRGVGTAIVRLLLDHPRVRGARSVGLGTRDAHTFYEPLGFARWTDADARERLDVEMVLRR